MVRHRTRRLHLRSRIRTARCQDSLAAATSVYEQGQKHGATDLDTSLVLASEDAMTFSATIDWDAHWKATDRSELSEMEEAGRRMARRLERYFDSFPETVADVGCGPAFTLFELARAHPGATFVGYDAAESIVAANRSRVAEDGIDNLRFRHGSLPGLSVDRTFRCVTCIATLHYVADIETALEALFAHVEPGGVLIFNYPNRHTQRAYRTDPETDRDRFELLLRGENLLTYEDIRRVLGRRPRSFWKAVGEENWRSLGQTNPCVVVEK